MIDVYDVYCLNFHLSLSSGICCLDSFIFIWGMTLNHSLSNTMSRTNGEEQIHLELNMIYDIFFRTSIVGDFDQRSKQRVGRDISVINGLLSSNCMDG